MPGPHELVDRNCEFKPTPNASTGIAGPCHYANSIGTRRGTNHRGNDELVWEKA